MIQDLVTEIIDYKSVFKQSPGVVFLLSPSFEILDVCDDVLQLTGREQRHLVGRNFFDAFPANPGIRGDTGPRRLRAELAKAARTGDRAVIRLNQYDIEDPGRPGVFEERFWSGVATPILDDDGRVVVIALWGHDTTPIVSQLWAQAATQG